MAVLHIVLRDFTLVDLLFFREEVYRELLLVRAWGLEPQRRKAREPKSRMSTNSIMPAFDNLLYQTASAVASPGTLIFYFL